MQPVKNGQNGPNGVRILLRHNGHLISTHLWNRLSTFIPKHLLQNLKNLLVAKRTIYGRILGRPVDSWVAFGDRISAALPLPIPAGPAEELLLGRSLRGSTAGPQRCKQHHTISTNRSTAEPAGGIRADTPSARFPCWCKCPFKLISQYRYPNWQLI